MSEDKKQGKSGMSRGMKVLLAVSLGLNMLVVGAVGGMMYHRAPMEGGIGVRDTAYGPYTRALSHQDRREIGKAMRREMGAVRQNGPEIRAAFSALREALLADDYDREHVRQLLQDQQAIGLKRYQVGQRLLLERLDAMSVVDRQKFAERLGWARHKRQN